MAEQPEAPTTRTPFTRLSVVIPNYNYAAYVGAAIESALSVDWPDVEVIVVDDGSTDDSRAVIERYGSRVTAVFQDNAGPRHACNAGFARSTGEIVVFLDSDDRLEPVIARELVRVWRPGVSKVQFPMVVIDRDGRPTGGWIPAFRRTPSPEEVRRWMRWTSAYPTPPGSGNAYARWFLERLFPLGDDCGDATDSACLAAAPFLGDVVTVPQPLAQYRQHGDNRSHLLSDTSRFTKQLQRAHQRHVFAQRLDPSATMPDAALFRGRHLLQLRAAGARMRPADHPIPGDSRLRMFGDAVVSPFVPGPEGLVHRLAVSAWTMATLVAPPRMAERLVRSRFRQGRVSRVRRVPVAQS